MNILNKSSLHHATVNFNCKQYAYGYLTDFIGLQRFTNFYIRDLQYLIETDIKSII